VDPVRYPTPVARVTQTGRVQRAQARKDPGRRSAFARFLRRDPQLSEDARFSAEEPEEAADAAGVESPAAGGSPTASKRIDIRV
jgi:hypothetical protein